MLNVVAIIFHLVAINIWVGGMFFMIMVLGNVVATLEQHEQQVFWQAVLKRFFFWVWLAVVGLLVTGVLMILYRFGGLGHAPLYVLLMASFGLSMVAIFFVIYFIYYRKFRHQLARENTEACRQLLRMIRGLGIVNMVLGFAVVVVIGSGPYLFF